MSFLGTPLGYIMQFCYYILPNYGLALLLFTLISRAAMFPLSLKQQKSQGKMAVIQPQITELQNKYKNNKEKLNEEMMKLYQEQGYNPLSGCLPLLIQFPIMFGLIDVIYKPLKHILRLSTDVIEKGQEIYMALAGVDTVAPTTVQLNIVSGVKENPAAYAALGQEAIDKILNLNLNFLGMNLTMKPDLSMISFSAFNPVILIPLFSGLTSLLMSLVTMRHQSASAGGNPSMKGMMLMMPLMSTWFTYSVSAGVGLYWTYSNIIAIVQQLVMNKIYNPREEAEKARLEMEERKERERQERIEAKKAAREAAKAQGGAEVPEKALTAKEINRKKLAEARKRDAEKYGEVYVEVTDEDLV